MIYSNCQKGGVHIGKLEQDRPCLHLKASNLTNSDIENQFSNGILFPAFSAPNQI